MNSHARLVIQSLAVVALASAVLAGTSAVAGAARDLGSLAAPAGATASPCGTGQVVTQSAADPSTPYAVPVGGGQLTQWQTNTSGDTAGSSLTFVVVRPSTGAYHTVVAADTRTLPSPLPADGVATFPLSPAITVQGGDELALYTNSGSGPTCWWSGGGTPSAGRLTALGDSSAPAPGQTLTADANGDSPPGYALDLAATLVSNDDVGVGAAASPQSVTVGNLAQLSATVTDGGPDSGPIAFTDDVPSGLQIQSVVAGSGTCSAVGQRVTCTITGLSPQQSAPVDIAVTPVAAGTYVNQVAVSPAPGVDDPVAGNNAAATMLSVVALPLPPPVPAAPCVVPPLARTPLAIAERVLILLGCHVGHVTAVHTKTISAGLVIKTGPVAGSYAAGRSVAIDVSAGPRHRPRRAKRKVRTPPRKTATARRPAKTG